ncbi:MAG TPA: hypothetical protein VH599_12420 [Ktedonobacterales bacterium]
MAADVVTWEHLVVYLEADARQQASFLQEKWPGQKFPMYAAQALMPLLDDFGRQGWELVSIQPVIVGIMETFRSLTRLRAGKIGGHPRISACSSGLYEAPGDLVD